MPNLWSSFKGIKVTIVVLVMVLVALQYQFLFGKNGLMQAFRLKSEISRQQAKNATLLKGNENLAEEINALKNSSEAIENRARGELGMVKKGEVFYQVVR